jgi:hypothetical protein
MIIGFPPRRPLSRQQGWKMEDLRIKTADGGTVVVK